MGFRKLLEEVLEALNEGRSGWDEELRREVREQAQLPRKGEDPIAQALHLGRQALLALVEGRKREACGLLLEAVRLHPNLGSGLAHQLAELVCQGEKELSKLRSLRKREERAWREAPPMVRLLRLLKELPPEAWEPILTPEPAARPAARLPHRQVSPRPFLTFPMQPTPRGLRGKSEGTILYSLSLSTSDRAFINPRDVPTWASPDQAFRLRKDRLRVDFQRFPQAGGSLLYLQGSLGSVLVPLAKAELHLPPLAEEDEVLEAELWRWADLTPKAFLERYQKASYAPKEWLAAWIEAGVRRGKLDLEAWQPVLEILRSP